MDETTMIKRICLITNYNLYNSKRYFAEKLSEALRRKGIETKLIDAEESALDREMGDDIVAFNPDLTCSLNTFQPTVEGQYLWDILQIPHLYIHLDPALYASPMTRSPYLMIACVDHFDVEALRASAFPNVIFLPHAIERELTYQEKEARPYDVVFLGSCSDYESLQALWKTDFSKELQTVLEEASEMVLSDNHTSLAQALVNAWSKQKLDPIGVDFLTLFKYIDFYTRGRDRVELIRSITDVPVHVFGDVATDIASCQKGWDYYLGSQPNVVLHPPVPFPMINEVLKKSKICLNSMPFFKKGTHERLFYALGCGALPATTDNLWVRENFVDGEELLLYRNQDFSSLQSRIKNYLSDETKRRQAVAAGRKKVLQNHTWDIRVDQLLKELPSMIQNIQSKVSA